MPTLNCGLIAFISEEVNMASIFRLSGFLVLPFWALMIVLPRWRWTSRVMQSLFISIAPAALYIALVLPRLGEIWPAVSRPTLIGIASLLGTPAGATIAWVHFLAFDLFVGRWIYLDSRERQMSVWLTAPVLFFTFMLGPLGFLLYLMVRSIARSAGDNRNAIQHFEAKEAGNKSLVGNASFKNTLEAMRRFAGSAWKTNRALTITGMAMVIVLLATLVGLLIDHRVITGAPAWLKPAKFAISVSVYCFTFVWLLGFVENHPRLTRLVANVTAISLIVEMIVIVMQAARGITSHFNVTTPLNTLLWSTMGLFISCVWLMNLLLAIMLIRQRIANRPFAWSLRLGVLVSAVGMAIAFLMVRPTPAQFAALAGHAPHIVGAHSVGVADGGPGLSVVGWSTVGGDLRVAHFLGLHALQLLPLFGWLLSRRNSRAVFLREGHRVALVWIGGLTYLGLVLLLAWQALRGQSVIHPDGKTITAAIVFASAGVVSASITLVRAQITNKRLCGLISRGIADKVEHSSACPSA
jgi:Domain of unknown function (DUF4281)